MEKIARYIYQQHYKQYYKEIKKKLYSAYSLDDELGRLF